MSVMLPNCRLAVARATEGGADAHGVRTAGGWAAPTRALAGRKRQRTGAGEGPDWSLALDPTLWPIRERDRILDPATGEVWLVHIADLIVNNADPVVDYVRVNAYAVDRPTGATEPGGPRFGGG